MRKIFKSIIYIIVLPSWPNIGNSNKMSCRMERMTVGPPESGACRLCLGCQTIWPVSDLKDGLCSNCHSSAGHDSPKVEPSYKPASGKKAKAIKGQLNLFEGSL